MKSKHRAHWIGSTLAVILGLLGPTGCKPKPQPQKEGPPAAATSTAAPAVLATASATAAVIAPMAPVTPTWAPQKFLKNDTVSGAVVDNAILVFTGVRVGKLSGDTIEWVDGKLPANSTQAANSITSLHGTWPDGIDATLRDALARGSIEAYAGFSGGSKSFQISYGTHRFATVGTSTVFIDQPYRAAQQIITVRGPKVARVAQSAESAGCEKALSGEPPALPMSEAVGTRSGWLVTLGFLCSSRGVYAEVWNPQGKSTLVDLRGWFKAKSDAQLSPDLLPGPKDQIYALSPEDQVVLRFESGEFAVLPAPPMKFTRAFVSIEKTLYLTDESTIVRFDGTGWSRVAELQWPLKAEYGPHGYMTDDNTFYFKASATLYKLAPATSLALTPECKTPFVHLYDVSEKNDAKFTFPSTRKALGDFPGADKLELLDFIETGGVPDYSEKQVAGRRLGVQVGSKEQAEALTQHLKANMKGESPRLICYEPKNPRRIPIKG